jgi:hypothetical protein
MTHVEFDPSGEVQRTIDREAELVASAVRLVASGGAQRTVVAGLRLGEAALTIVGPLAVSLGVLLEPMWRADEEGTDVVVRRPDGSGVRS